MKEYKKPLPYNIKILNTTFDYAEIMYCCPSCRAEFTGYGDKENFCHNCGQEIDWGVLFSINKEMLLQFISLKQFDEKNAFFNAINLLNKNAVKTSCTCQNFNEKTKHSWEDLFNSCLTSSQNHVKERKCTDV